jgi:hypothetical protein
LSGVPFEKKNLTKDRYMECECGEQCIRISDLLQEHQGKSELNCRVRRTEFGQALKVIQAKRERDQAWQEIIEMKRRLNYLAANFKPQKRQYTGSFVLLKKKGNKYEFVAIYDPDKAEEDNEPVWDLGLPIPKDAPEFNGW